MKRTNLKLVLSAAVIAVLATPAFASSHQVSQRPIYNSVRSQVGTYPDGGAGRTGTAASEQSGAEFNLKATD
jgi:hypothetical protein